jgi:hypothetical protein
MYNYIIKLLEHFMISVQVNWDNIGKNLNIFPLKIIKLIFYYVKFDEGAFFLCYQILLSKSV